MTINLIITVCAWHSASESRSRTYHPVENYLNDPGNQHNLTQGRKVLFVVSVNGWRSCLEMIKSFARSTESKDIKFIYSIEHSIEHRRLVDIEIIELSREKPKMVILDYKNTPFREGLVADSPIVYFLADGLMVDSVQLTPRIFDETVLKVLDYIY